MECDQLFAAPLSVQLADEHWVQKVGSRRREVLVVAIQDLVVETNDAGCPAQALMWIENCCAALLCFSEDSQDAVHLAELYRAMRWP